MNDKKENSVFDDYLEFSKKNNLDKLKFEQRIFLRKIHEEIFELIGYDSHHSKSMAIRRAEIDDDFSKEPKAITESGKTVDVKIFKNSFTIADALCDIINFCLEGLLQNGFNPEIAMRETIKEILSRDGELVNGKFTKFTDEKSMAKWYKADYHKARLKDYYDTTSNR